MPYFASKKEVFCLIDDRKLGFESIVSLPQIGDPGEELYFRVLTTNCVSTVPNFTVIILLSTIKILVNAGNQFWLISEGQKLPF